MVVYRNQLARNLSGAIYCGRTVRRERCRRLSAWIPLGRTPLPPTGPRTRRKTDPGIKMSRIDSIGWTLDIAVLDMFICRIESLLRISNCVLTDPDLRSYLCVVNADSFACIWPGRIDAGFRATIVKIRKRVKLWGGLLCKPDDFNVMSVHFTATFKLPLTKHVKLMLTIVRYNLPHYEHSVGM